MQRLKPPEALADLNLLHEDILFVQQSIDRIYPSRMYRERAGVLAAYRRHWLDALTDPPPAPRSADNAARFAANQALLGFLERKQADRLDDSTALYWRE